MYLQMYVQKNITKIKIYAYMYLESFQKFCSNTITLLSLMPYHKFSFVNFSSNNPYFLSGNILWGVAAFPLAQLMNKVYV